MIDIVSKAIVWIDWKFVKSVNVNISYETKQYSFITKSSMN